MELTAQTINVVLLLLPGLVGLHFYSLLSGSTPESLWKHLIDSLIFTLVIYVPLEALGLWEPVVQLDGSTMGIVIAEPKNIAGVLISALLLAGIYSLLIHAGIISRVLRTLRLSTLTPHKTAWHDVMNRKKYIRVYRKSGDLFLGWPRYYSLSSDYGFIFLEDLYFYDDDLDDWVHMDDAEGVLLNYDDVDSIEVSNDAIRGR